MSCILMSSIPVALNMRVLHDIQPHNNAYVAANFKSSTYNPQLSLRDLQSAPYEHISQQFQWRKHKSAPPSMHNSSFTLAVSCLVLAVLEALEGFPAFQNELLFQPLGWLLSLVLPCREIAEGVRHPAQERLCGTFCYDIRTMQQRPEGLFPRRPRCQSRQKHLR